MEEIKNKFINQKFDLNVLNAEVEKKYQQDPFNTIVPAGFTGRKDDPNEIIYKPVIDTLNANSAKLNPLKADFELQVSSLIGCVPDLSPIAQGIFACFMGCIKDAQYTKDEVKKIIDQKFTQYKKELENIINEKVDKSKVNQYITICNTAFNGLINSSLELLIDDLNNLKSKLLSNEKVDVNDSFMVSVRGKFDIMRINIMRLIPLFTNVEILPLVYTQFLQMMFLYILTLQNLINYWYQFGFDPIYSRGSIANYSYREILHINIQKSLKTIQIVIKKNQKGLENLSKMLESDPVLYPAPLFKAQVVPSFNDMINVRKNNLSYSTPVVDIDVNMHPRPFIYRIDGVNFIGDWKKEESSGFPRRVPTEPDQITGCIGFYIWSVPQINVILSEPKYISLRLFTKNTYPIIVRTGGIIEDCEINGHDVESGSFAPSIEDHKDYGRKDYPHQEFHDTPSGFNLTSKSSQKVKELDISIESNSFKPSRFDKLLFVEVIVSDD